MKSFTGSAMGWGLRQFGAMRFHISGDARLLPMSFRLKRRHLIKFAQDGALDERLAQIDEARPIGRIFVMGCGRSGTWLLTALMSTFRDTCVVAKEAPVELFAKLTTTGKTLVLKRNNVAFQRILQIPNRIKIAYIIRHPYDVLTSHNPTSERTYHIDSERWLGEMTALRTILEMGEKHIFVVRYEDLVADAGEVQRKLGDKFGLDIGSSIEHLPKIFKASREASSAMHGLRGVDASSLHKYKSDPLKIAYLKDMRRRLGDMLDWVAGRFGYDVHLT
jgi:hypothetical protein